MGWTAVTRTRAQAGHANGKCHAPFRAHAEFLNLVAARHSGRPPKLLACVERRYQAQQPVATAWHWRRVEPFDRLPSGRSLLIESPAPFRLHHGFDGWREVVDTLSESQGLGMQASSLMRACFRVTRQLILPSTFPKAIPGRERTITSRLEGQTVEGRIREQNGHCPPK